MVAISFGKVRLGRVGGGRPGLPAALWAAPSQDRAAPCELRPGSGHAFGFLSLGNRTALLALLAETASPGSSAGVTHSPVDLSHREP